MSAVPDLFGPRPPADRRVLMHAIDSGSFPDGKDAAHFRCRRCGHDTGWIYALRNEARRGIACPFCNASSGERPSPLPLPDPDMPAVSAAGGVQPRPETSDA